MSSKAALWMAPILLIGGLVSTTPAAQAGPDCAYRGGAHIARHGGKLEDDAYHIGHHERVTCDEKHDDDDKDFTPYENHDASRHADESHDDGKHDDTNMPGHRDKPGYGCFMLRCG